MRVQTTQRAQALLTELGFMSPCLWVNGRTHAIEHNVLSLFTARAATQPSVTGVNIPVPTSDGKYHPSSNQAVSAKNLPVTYSKGRCDWLEASPTADEKSGIGQSPK